MLRAKILGGKDRHLRHLRLPVSFALYLQLFGKEIARWRLIRWSTLDRHLVSGTATRMLTGKPLIIYVI